MTRTHTVSSRRNPELAGARPAIHASGLRCRYGDYLAVDGVDLSVRPGELFALLGTNGAGKTTTVETLEGHRRADAGDISVLGRDPYRHRRQLAGQVSMVLQESGFTANLTAAETLRLWRHLNRGRTGPADPLADVDLSHRADVRVGQLSGGERRRLDLALAISTAPSVLFLDEPTTGMDPTSRERTWALLRNLVDSGCAVLLTTHYLEEAEELADHLAIMHKGRVAVAGTVAQVAASHAAKIGCALPAAIDAASLPRFDGDVSLMDDALTVRTTRLQADLHLLLNWANDNRLDLGQLTAAEASLREVFAAVQATDITTDTNGR
ncbi:ABC transporter ATP-binding protein [Stackebrandtia nassauensis]|uniref:ABC transporter related protein n=1 Tax=Stackebrandtia nassauensis (strain DSM 44728 / CIP 108903 / NRRL B-16338 / NBRC 102104 / LLR-40K-21) TaxID=446470 RepID=D3Q5S1_STANL|nr:ABC transporter ATP-binding protein [Stackebrandtia nassauensis]ADD40220.1 ABC transporter related protein [Stackebrandtia nassauensis DSM 44728]